jgi:phosphoenolpyruvate carboxykinase (GTP)
VFERCDGGGDAVESPIGILPGKAGISTEGLDVSDADMAELLRVDVDEWKAELPDIRAHFETYGERMPKELWAQYEALEKRLGA